MSRENAPHHERLPAKRPGHIYAFKIDGVEGHVITSNYDDGRLGQIFIYVAKQGSALRGVYEAWATAVSLGLQHGVPLESYVEKYVGQQFEPNGITNDEQVRIVSSVGDYIFRRLALDYLSPETLDRFDIDPT